MSLMLNGNVINFFKSEYKCFYQTISELSKSDDGSCFIESDIRGWNFDGITKVFFRNNVPCSADGIFFNGKWIYFVEFKTGYKTLITKKSIDEKKIVCEYKNNEPCEKYGSLLKDKGKFKSDVLKSNIMLKAVEGYRTFEKKVAPLVKDGGDGGKKYCLKFIVVVDNEKSENEECESILADMAKKDLASNCLVDMRKTLSRFGKPDVWYDEVCVMSGSTFKSFAELNFLSSK